MARQTMAGMIQRHYVLLDWYQLVYAYGILPYVAHRAFLLINEYQALIKDAGFGPAKGEPGHDPNIPFGRAVNYQVPVLNIFTSGRATHFWPDAATAPSPNVTQDDESKMLGFDNEARRIETS